MFFSPNLFNLYNDPLLRELEVLQEFTIVGHYLNIKHANDTLSKADAERK